MDKSERKKIEKPKRAGDTRRKRKKSLAWQDDPEILTRLAYVAQLMNQNKPAYLIAEKTKVSYATAKRDMLRVREIWREDAKSRLTNTVDTALAQYGAVIEKAWDDMQSLSPGNVAITSYMNVILRAQDRIDKVTGIADPVELQGKDGGPIELSIAEMEKVRESRWKKIADKLAVVVAASSKESNGTKPNTPS